LLKERSFAINTGCQVWARGATGCGYASVFTAYECLTFHHRILTCQVWARGLGQGKMQNQRQEVALVKILAHKTRLWLSPEGICFVGISMAYGVME